MGNEFLKLSTPDFTTEIFRTYESLPSNEILMISELIDNSIASATNNKFDLLPTNLKIEILIDEKDLNNREITVVDNANGFTLKELEEGLKLGRRIKKDGASFYNKGLKQSAFWSGECLEIETYSKVENKFYSVEIDLPKLDKENDGNVVYEILQNKNNKNLISPIKKDGIFLSGTIVKFKKLFDYRWDYSNLITKNKNFKDKNLLLIMLGTKYEFLLSQDNCLEIWFEWRTPDERRSFAQNIEPQKIKSDNFFEWAEYTYQKDKRYVDSGKEEFTTFEKFYGFLKQKFEESFDSYVKKNNSDSNVYKNIELRKRVLKDIFEEKKDFLWDESIEMEVTDVDGQYRKIFINGTMGIIRKKRIQDQEYNFTFTDWKGISFSQFNRKLVYPPNSLNNDENLMRAYQFVDDHPGTDKQPLTRIFGNFSFDPFWSKGVKIVKPDDNKRSFIWENNKNDYKGDFFRKLENIFEYKYGPIAHAFHNCQQAIDTHMKPTKTSGNQDGKDDEGTNTNIPTSGFDPTVIDVESIDKDDARIYTVNLENKKLKVILEQVVTKLADDPILDANNLSEDELKVSINLNHIIWKPLLDDTRDDSDIAIFAIEKILVMVGLVQLGYSSKIDFSSNDFFDVFNNIANIIKAKDE